MIIDFHSHILPGIDDGAKDAEISRQMLIQASEQGIEYMLASPHFYADEYGFDAFLRRREEAYAKLVGMDGPILIKAAELGFFLGISESQKISQLAAGSVLLIEMPFRQWTEKDVTEIEALVERGFTVVIAHIERFINKDNERYVDMLMDLPLVFQVNGEVIIEQAKAGKLDQLIEGASSAKRGLFTRKSATPLFRNGLKYVLGSDTHSLHRRPQNLAEARAILGELSPRLLEEIDRTSEELLALMNI